MNGTNIVIDANAVIHLIDQRCDFAALGLNIDEGRLFTSVIVRMELLSKRDMQDDEEQDIKDFLEDLTIIPLSEEIERTAIALRRAGSLKLPDCIVAATAIVLDALLLTNDDHLLKLSWPGLRTQRIV